MALNDGDKVIRKGYARAGVEEICSVCLRLIPEGKLILRHKDTRQMICLLCIVAIAEVE